MTSLHANQENPRDGHGYISTLVAKIIIVYKYLDSTVWKVMYRSMSTAHGTCMQVRAIKCMS